jgi:hypothetical protein
MFMTTPDFAGVRLLLCGLLLLGSFALWRRPRALFACLLLGAVNLLAYAAYMAPLQRPYALDTFSDRTFNAGMAASAAAGNSPLEHTQVGMASLEPFWNVTIAALSGFRPEAVLTTFRFLPAGVLVLLCAALYVGLRAPGVSEWERLLMAFSVLALASHSSSLSPSTGFWPSVLAKPNHATGFVLIAILLGLRARGAAAWKCGLVLGGLAWVFLIHWAYLCAALVAAEILTPPAERRLRQTALTLAIGGALGVPMFLHLFHGYSPWAEGSSAQHMWAGTSGAEAFSAPQWMTLDLGIEFSLGIAGLVVLWRRRGALDRQLLALVAVGAAFWGYYLFAPLTHFAPESDDLHVYLRFGLALAAGAFLAAAARVLEERQPALAGRGALLVLVACVPFTFWSYWDPPTMDRYWRGGREPIPADVLDYARWIRENTAPSAVFASSGASGGWIPALAGRQVLLASSRRPPHDFDLRRALLKRMSSKPRLEVLQSARERYRVQYLVLDHRRPRKHARPETGGGSRLVATGFYRLSYSNAAVDILELALPETPSGGRRRGR